MTRQSILCAILLATLVVSGSYAQTDSTLRPSSESTGAVILSDALMFAPSGILFILNHELGHFTLATIFGGEHVRFGLSRTSSTGSHQLGWTDWSNDIGSTGRACADLGGVLFSRGLAEGSNLVVKHIPIQGWGQRFFSMTFLFGRFDFSRYVLMDALVSLAGRPGSDINQFVTELCGQQTSSRVLLYSALIGLATIDLILDWERISMHWKIVTGSEYYDHTDDQHAHIQLRPIVTSVSFGLNVSLFW